MTDGPPHPGDLLDHVPEGPVPSSQRGERLLDLVRVMARLRGPGGCPWDAEQTHVTLARHLLEETHELLEAIDAADDDAMRDELGDVLLQVVFHAQMAADEGRWDVDDVAEGLVRKLVYRHPHVFGEVEVTGADEVLVNWEKLKAAEAGGVGARAAVDDDIPASLPSLARAAKVQRRAAGWGFEWRSVDSAVGALREEVDELAAATADPLDAEEEVGDVLFATVALARKLGVDAESALRRTVRGFSERYERFVDLASERGLDVERAGDPELRSLFREAREVPGAPEAREPSGPPESPEPREP
ncbi:MAG: nucleoside triphosphate pyrophosphohydrolase [Actinomycetota bacterium]